MLEAKSSLDVVVPNQGHPDNSDRCKRKWKQLRRAKRHGLEHKQLATKVAQGNNIRPQRNVVHGAQVQVIRRIEADNACN